MNKEYFEAYYRTYNSGDAQALGEFYADDVVLVSGQGEVKGREAMLQTYHYITSQLRDQMTPTRIFIDGDRAAVEITDVFTAKTDIADFLGVALKQGESFTIKICGVYRVENGKLKQITIYRC